MWLINTYSLKLNYIIEMERDLNIYLKLKINIYNKKYLILYYNQNDILSLFQIIFLITSIHYSK